MPNHRRFTDEQEAGIRARYDAGASCLWLSKELGCSDRTIKAAIHRQGGLVRPLGPGPRSGNWTGGTHRTSCGYVMEYYREGPHMGMSTKAGYVLQHRLRMAEMLGRDLSTKENVHHRNGVRDDNRIENLELWTRDQPSGQRVADKVAWAIELLERYNVVGKAAIYSALRRAREVVREPSGKHRGRGGRFPDAKGYIRLHIGHGKCVAEHRHLMALHLGRDLLPGENVHHINGIRDDNRLENLELWTTGQPSGQRVEDKIRWAIEFLERYDIKVRLPTANPFAQSKPPGVGCYNRPHG